MLGNCLVEFKVIARFTIQIHARHIQSERPETRKNIFILPLKYSFQTSNLPKSVISKLKARHFLWMKKSLLFTFLIYFVSLYWKISFTFSRNSKSEINITYLVLYGSTGHHVRKSENFSKSSGLSGNWTFFLPGRWTFQIFFVCLLF